MSQDKKQREKRVYDNDVISARKKKISKGESKKETLTDPPWTGLIDRL